METLKQKGGIIFIENLLFLWLLVAHALWLNDQRYFLFVGSPLLDPEGGLTVVWSQISFSDQCHYRIVYAVPSPTSHTNTDYKSNHEQHSSNSCGTQADPDGPDVILDLGPGCCGCLDREPKGIEEWLQFVHYPRTLQVVALILDEQEIYRLWTNIRQQ